MKLLENALYQSDLKMVFGLDLPWQMLDGKRILISGATGMIGSTLIDVLMKRNREDGGDCFVTALGRNEAKAKERFAEYWEDPHFSFACCDINDAKSLEGAVSGNADYVFHAASNTHPVAYANDPIGTVVTNIIGLNNLLALAADHGCSRFLFASSNEIYGENRGDAELFDEKYCGYIDCNTMRAGYPESKRAGEALCQAYIRQKGLDVVIPRFTRSFGPALLKTDTKALSQFLHKGVNSEDIIDLAKIIADYVGRKVVFDLPDAVESAGFSKATKARLDSTKLQALGWKAQFDMKTGLEHTIDILKNLEN